MTASRHHPATLLAAMLATTGTLHFVAPKPFDTIVPRALPGPRRRWTHLSGAAELGVAAAVAVPRSRRAGGLAAAALFVAIFPANLQMAADWRHKALPYRLLAWGRLPLQLPLIAWALRASRDQTEEDDVAPLRFRRKVKVKRPPTALDDSMVC